MSKLKPNHGPVAFMGFRGGPGGISHVMIHLMNGFARMGLETEILLNKEDIPELSLLDPRIVRRPLKAKPGLASIPPLAAYMKARKPQVILANREPAVRALILAKQWTRTSTRTAVRVGMPISVALGRRSWLKRWIRRGFIRYCYRRADTIIANSGDVAKDIVDETGLHPGRIALLPNPTVDDAIYSRARLPVSHPWLADKEVPVITAVGRLAPQKDFLTLLRAFALLRRERTCRLLILGEGKQRTVLAQEAERLGITKELSMPGFVDNPFAYLVRSDLFVLSSAWEGSPNVLIEALALGVPSVAADCGSGPREILADGRYGPLVPVGDAQAMARAMAQVLESPLPREVLEEAVEPFRTQKAVRRYVETLGLAEGAVP